MIYVVRHGERADDTSINKILLKIFNKKKKLN